ncbi:hypothetical protein CAPTEDRAFT_36674, partial [Capitella teleta]
EASASPFFDFKDKRFPSQLLQGLSKQREHGIGLDLTIRVEERTITAHRNIVMASSTYFDALLGPNMKEGKESSVELQGIKYAPLNQLIDFMYSADIAITSENVQDILETANFVGMISICGACCRFLAQHLDVSNCADILQLASALDQDHLKGDASDFFCTHFFEIQGNEGFMSIDITLLTGLLAEDNLRVIDGTVQPTMENVETALLNIVMNYINFHMYDEPHRLAALLETVRLP